MQGLGIITPTHSLSPGIWAFCEYRKKRGFLNRYPRTTVWERGGREGRMNLFPSSEATILDEQIIRMDQKWLISSDRCQIWQIRAWGHGHSSRNPVSFDRSDNIDRWTCQILEVFTSDWQLRSTSDGQISEFSHTWDDLAGICNNL